MDNGTSARLLLISDDKQEIACVMDLLQKCRHELNCNIASDSHEIRAYLQEYAPAFIISAFVMSNLTGIEALRLCKSFNASVPFVFFTKSINEESAVACLKAGADDYILNTNPDGLLNLLNDFFGNHPSSVLKSTGSVKNNSLRIQKELELSEEMYRGLIASLPDIIIRTDIEGNIIFINNADLSNYGYDNPDEVLGLNLMSFLAPEDIPKALHNTERMFNEYLGPQQYRALTKNNEISVLELNGDVLRNSDGTAFGIVYVIRDITERKLAEEALLESRKTFQNYFEMGTIGLSVTSTDKKYLEVNRKACQMLGYTREELLQMTWMQVTHPDDLESNVHYFEKVKLQEMDSYQMNKRFIRKNGEAMFAVLYVVCQRNTDGSVRHFLSSMIDITERTRAEEALRKSEESYRRIVETAQEGICLMDAHENPVFVNAKMAQLMGYAVDEMMLHPYYYYLFDEDIPDHHNHMRQRNEGQNAYYERRFRRKDGSTLWCLVSATAVFDDKGNYNGSFGMFVDITESKRQQEELLKAKEKAEQSNSLKDAFISNISHEIRTPLNGILGFTGLLETHFAARASGEAMMYFNRINKSGKRLMRTVEMIMNFSRLRLGDFRIHPRLINTKQFIDSIVDEFIQTNEKANLNIIFENYCQNPDVITDEYALNNILNELIDNAVKFTVSGRVKVVLYNNQNDRLCIDVKDTGIGMSEEYLKRIFEPYLQEEVGFTRNYEGIGLGLSIVKKLADNIGVIIKVKSKKGLGSVFTIVFENHGIMPKTEPAAISDQTSDTVSKQAGVITKPVILVVEDDETSQLFIHMVLKKDYAVLPAVSATEAIEIIKQYKVDLVLMDISLKGLMNGFELTQWIRERQEYSNLSVIAVTAHAFESDKNKAEEAGCNFYITKPFKPATLLNAISQMLRKNRVIQ